MTNDGRAGSVCLNIEVGRIMRLNEQCNTIWVNKPLSSVFICVRFLSRNFEKEKLFRCDWMYNIALTRL